MAGERVQVPLGEVITLQRGFDLPSQKRKLGKVPIVSSSGISDYHSDVGVKGPGVVTGRYGTIGQVFLIKEDYWPLNTTLWVKDFHGNDPHFASYLLRTIDFQSCSDKSSVPGVNRNDLHRIPVLLPPLAEQRAIAHVLGTLDDLIELNRETNEILEEMARALFKSWFVDFDPVRAKLEGRTPAGMDAAIAALFPDHFQDSPIGPVPNGWKVQRFDAHITPERGLSYKGEGLRDDGTGLPMHNLNSIYEGGGYKHEGLKFYAGEFRAKHLLEPGDMIVTNTEQGFEHMLIGHAAIVPMCYGPKGIYSHHIYRVRPKPTSPFSPHYLVELFNNRRWHFWISGFSNGTTINMLPMDALEMPMLVVPPIELVKKFTALAEAAHIQVEDNKEESRDLATLRDTLLPKLLSGEVSAPAAVELIAAST
jgi:type I restriction enzyme S subunit